MAKVLEGYVGDGAGEPLDAIAATVTKVADGSAVTAGATDVNGRWRFTGLAEADEYFVTLVDGAGRAVVRGPWSGELREAWVRDRLAMPAAATAVLPEGDTVFLGTLAFDPAVGDGALDHRYVDIDGDTMTGPLVVPALTVAGVPINQTALDARYVNTAGDAMTGALTAPSLSVGGNDISYPSLDARYVNTSGDAMSGTLAVPSLTVAGVAITPTMHDTRYVNVTGDVMSGTLDLQSSGNALVAQRAGVSGAGVVLRGSLGTIVTPADNVAGNWLGLLTAEARVAGAWQATARHIHGVAAVAGGLATGGYSLALADATGTLVERIGASGAGTVALTGDTTVLGLVHIQKDGDVIIGHALGATGPVIRTRGSRGTLAAPANSTAGDVVRYDIAEAHTNSVWQNLSIMGVQGQAASGGKMRGDWWLDLADATGTMANRLQVLGTGLTTVYGPLAVNGELTVNTRPVAMAGCRVRRTTVQGLTSGTAAAIAFDAERYDTDAFHEPATNNTRLTIPTGLAGKYLMVGHLEFTSNATGFRALSIRRNGASQLLGAFASPPVSGDNTALTVTAIYDLAVGDYVELYAYQNSGTSPLNALVSNYSMEFELQRIG